VRPAVFIDRDDTLIDTRGATAGTDHVGDMIDPAKVALLPGAGDACRQLASVGFPLVVVSNQGAVARGRCTLREVEAVNDRIRALLEQFGVRLAATYVAPHHPEGNTPPYNAEHPWRKPEPGMYYAAAKELGIDLEESFAIGDASRDVLSAVTAGLATSRAIIVGKGPGVWYADLAAAVAVILPRLKQMAGPRL
jgi:histidinol-phosphate phosphatase family protein